MSLSRLVYIQCHRHVVHAEHHSPPSQVKKVKETLENSHHFEMVYVNEAMRVCAPSSEGGVGEKRHLA